MKRSLQIGILKLMHNKVATNHDFQRILTTDPQYLVILHFYYPPTHYQDQSIPLAVQQNLKSLDLQEVATLDAFIITGAPIEQIDFESVTYI